MAERVGRGVGALTVKKDMGRKRMVTRVSCFMLSFW